MKDSNSHEDATVPTGDRGARSEGRSVGQDIYALITVLFPICRSITGNGARKTLNVIRQHIPLEIHEVASGTPVFDWTVPKEWNIHNAYVKNSKGEKIIDFKKSNLHVLNYSIPVNTKVSLTALKGHLYTMSDHPDWIPYRTSYYKENWGFCLSYNQFKDLKEDQYEVVIDSTLKDGSLTYGEYVVKGRTADEVLLSCHICHPSLCNDNLSGVALMTFLAKHLSTRSLRYSYRFLFIPGTIGSITWLSLNEEKVSRIRHGLVAACLGDSGGFTYKKSRQGDAEIDRVVCHVLRTLGKKHEILDFSPFGYDERQFCSPGFDLPVGCFMRTPHGRYPEYHTSADNLAFVHSDQLSESFKMMLAVFHVLENNVKYLNQNPKCEPQLGRRGLYQAIGGPNDGKTRELAMLWVLNMSDGRNSLLDISERSGIPFETIKEAAHDLREKELLKEELP
jgi:aminopeptidase-like protein